jgi:hypothetical protein
MENIVTITLLTLTLFGKIEMTTFEIPNTRENYDMNVKVSVKKNPKPGENHYKHRYKGKRVIGYICGGHEPR